MTTVIHKDGTKNYHFDPAPRLARWDEPRHRPTTASRSTDPSLQRIERGEPPNSLNRAEQGWGGSETRLSEYAEGKRRLFFAGLAVTSVFPFIGVIALCGGFDSSLSWITHGEVDRLTRTQKRWILCETGAIIILIITLAIWAILKKR